MKNHFRIHSLLACFVLMMWWGCTPSPDPDPEPTIEPDAPTVDFEYTKRNDGVAPSDVIFNVTIDTYDYDWKNIEWDFGDRTPKRSTTSSSIAHTYTKGGNYQVTVTITDNKERKASKTREVTITSRPTTVTITKVTLEDLPFTQTNGQLWDVDDFGDDAPDVYMKITDESLAQYLSTNRWDDLGKAQLPVSYAPNSSELARLRITNLSSVYYLELWDYDWGGSPSDKIGHIRFSIAEKQTTSNKFPSQITLEGSGIKAILELRWDGEDVVSGR